MGRVVIELRSDNAAGVAPEIMAAIVAADSGTAPAYGDDDVTARLHDVVRSVFEHPGASVFPVPSGTAANALALSAVCPPWGAVLCHANAHALTNECGATSLLGGGVIVRGVGAEHSRLTPGALQAAFDVVRWGDPHHSQPTALSITQATELGEVYSLDEIAELVAVARQRQLRIHVDGARLANAIDRLGCSPAELTWRAGVDVVSLGAIKNGAMSADAIVVFDDALAAELVYRTKRSGHVTSKMRYASAQLIAYLTDGLWVRLARHANQQMALLASELAQLGVGFVAEPAANLAFAHVSAAAAVKLRAAGLEFYDISPGVIRLVTSWRTTDAEIAEAVTAFRAALAASSRSSPSV